MDNDFITVLPLLILRVLFFVNVKGLIYIYSHMQKLHVRLIR